MSSSASVESERRLRTDRLGFRLDADTKALIERAAELEHRKVSDFCVKALTDAASRPLPSTTLILSEIDRSAFFDALVNPPEPDERLLRALAQHARRIGR